MELRIFGTRFSQEVHIAVTQTVTGWRFRYLTTKAEGGPSGKPGLYRCFDRYTISYPSALPLLMEELWHRSRSENWTDEQMQQRLDRLSAWVSEVERSTPDDSWLAS